MIIQYAVFCSGCLTDDHHIVDDHG